MYVQKIQLINYGPIERLVIDCPIDGDKPHPIVLVGENGSGKSILLSHIVNGLLCAKEVAYPGTPEVSSGKVYKLRSPHYIRTGKEFAFAQVDFEGSISIAELQLGKRQKDYAKVPDGILGTNAEQLWNSINSAENNNFSLQLDEVQIKELFEHNCVLYFPPNRFEEPAWLNEENLNAQARHVDTKKIKGETKRTVLTYSPLRDNENFLFALAFDSRIFELFTREINLRHDGEDGVEQTSRVSVIEGFTGGATTLFGAAMQVLKAIIQGQDVVIGIGRRENRVISVLDHNEIYVPNIFQLSSGEVSLLNIFLSILRDFDSCQTPVGKPIVKPEDIRGIVVIDEVDLHLHATHQYTILPQLIKMFPRVQFVITTHSPLFVLGLHGVLGDDGFGLYRLPNGQRIAPEEFSEFGNAYRVFAKTNTYISEMEAAIRKTERPLIFVEGKTDVEYLKRAIVLLGWSEACAEVEIRAAGGEGNLNQAWKALTQIKVVRQTVVLLYDCDSNLSSLDCGSVFRRKMSMIQDHPIRKGIENLFSKKTLNRARKRNQEFIDIIEEHSMTERGCEKVVPEKWKVNEDEKSNLCHWLCENGTPEDFRCFERILGDLRGISGLLGRITDETG